jgi:hypothetical protein
MHMLKYMYTKKKSKKINTYAHVIPTQYVQNDCKIFRYDGQQ